MTHTNKQLHIGALALVVGLYSAGALSASINGQADAEILEPVTLTLGATMDFSTIASGANATTVSVDNAGTVTAPAAAGNAIVTNSAGAALTFTVQAASGVAYVLNIADGSLDTAGGSGVGPMTVTNFGDNASLVGTGAPETVTVTGDLSVGASQDAGLYSTTNGTPVVITADYQ
jgi:hypothetical protein